MPIRPSWRSARQNASTQAIAVGIRRIVPKVHMIHE